MILWHHEQMPRKNPLEHQNAIRAYHRASAALRDLHREEWEVLRAQFRAEEDDKGYARLVRLPRGPMNGRRPVVTPYRLATVTDLADAAAIVTGLLSESEATATRVLDELTAAGFLFMRATMFDEPAPTEAAHGG